MPYFDCPHCDRSIDSEDVVGGWIACPRCHKDVSPPPGLKKRKKRRPIPDDDEAVERDYFPCPLCNSAVPMPGPGKRRVRCPSCQTGVSPPKGSDKAALEACRYCGKELINYLTCKRKSCGYVFCSEQCLGTHYRLTKHDVELWMWIVGFLISLFICWFMCGGCFKLFPFGQQ